MREPRSRLRRAAAGGGALVTIATPRHGADFLRRKTHPRWRVLARGLWQQSLAPGPASTTR